MNAERVKQIIQDQFDPDFPITLETTILGDLGADSLDTVELTMELEEEFDIAIPDADIGSGDDKTVGQVIAYITRRVAAERGEKQPELFTKE